MVYNEDTTWNDLSKMAGQQASDLIFALNAGLNSYNEWLSFSAGRTNAEIATALAKTEAQVAELGACFAAFKDIYDAANNVSVSQSDRFYSMRKFS